MTEAEPAALISARAMAFPALCGAELHGNNVQVHWARGGCLLSWAHHAVDGVGDGEAETIPGRSAMKELRQRLRRRQPVHLRPTAARTIRELRDGG